MNQKLSGAFLVYKEAGMTSHDVVFKLRKIIREKQIGHTGTLDPMAEGLMICLVGSTTKLIPFLENESKRYRVKFKLGVVTDTLDITGKVASEISAQELEKYNNIKDIIKLIHLQEGEFMWDIPLYSAKKINGKKLYETARENSKKDQEVVLSLPQKKMKFWDLTDVKIDFPYVELSFWCSKGSFVRSWVNEFGKKIGSGAVMTELLRLQISEFSIDHSLRLSEIEKIIISKNKGEIKKLDFSVNESFFIERNQLVSHLPSIQLEDDEKNKLLNGLISYKLQERIINTHMRGLLACFYEQHLLSVIEAVESNVSLLAENQSDKIVENTDSTHPVSLSIIRVFPIE